jgi:hypothetical protein
MNASDFWKFSSIFLLIALIIGNSCTSYNEKEKGRIIVIDEIKEQKLELSDIASQIKILPLETEADESMVGHIWDVCCVDDMVYILDDITRSILMFNMNTGKFIKRVHSIGQGPNEYVHPMALSSCADSVYLLDIAANRIICYDKHLNPVRTIRLSFASSDFTALADGFYLYNLSSFNLKKVVYLNKNGTVANSFISTSKNTTLDRDVDFTSNHFSVANSGDVYFVESLTNRIFCINNKTNVTVQDVDFGKNNIPKSLDINSVGFSDIPYALIAEFFALDNYSIISFFKDGKRYYSIFETSTGRQKTGIVTREFPFFPRWQLNSNILIGTCYYQDIEANFDNIKDCFVTDVEKDSIDDEASLLLFFNIDFQK